MLCKFIPHLWGGPQSFRLQSYVRAGGTTTTLLFFPSSLLSHSWWPPLINLLHHLSIWGHICLTSNTNTWWTCCRQSNHVVHMSTDIDICWSNPMSDIGRICWVLPTQLVETSMHYIRHLVGIKETRTKHSESHRKTFTCIYFLSSGWS